MAATAVPRRQLAHRTSNGIEISLLWSEPTNRVVVEVIDALAERSFEFEVAGSHALDAFHHPFAYAPSQVSIGSVGAIEVVPT